MGLKKISTMFLAMIVICVTSNAPAEENQMGRYNASAVNLRTTPSFSSPSLGWVNKGASCQILEESTTGDSLWYRVKITGVTVNKANLKGMTGWALAEFIDPVNTNAEESEELSEDELSEDGAPHEEDQSEEGDVNSAEEGDAKEVDEGNAYG